MTTVHPTRGSSATSPSRRRPIFKRRRQEEFDNNPARTWVGTENRGLTRDRMLRWSLGVGAFLFYVVTAVSGRLVQKNIWDSWIWWLLAAVIIVPLLIGIVRRRPVLRILLGLGMSIVAMMIMFVVLLLLISIGWSDDWLAGMVGNETMGSMGWVKAWLSLGLFWPIAAIGWVIIVLVIFLLLIAAPLLLFGLIDVLSFDEDFSIPAVLILSILAPLSSVFAIGQSIITNSGF